MKLKQFIIPVAGALLLGGCEADHRNDNLLDSVVYLLESDLQKALFYDIEETTDYSFRAFSVTPSELGIELSDDVLTAYNEANGTAYTALDPACYRLVNSTGSVDADHPSTTFTVQLDCSAIKQLGDLTSYVIPLRLTSSSSKVNEELGSILINPEMAETQVLVRNAGVVETSPPTSNSTTSGRPRPNTSTATKCSTPTMPSTVRTTCRSRPTPSPSRRHSSKWASARPCRISRSTSRS